MTPPCVSTGEDVSSQRAIGDAVRRLLHLASALDAKSMRERPKFFGDW
jgi:hypothetical protein